MKTETEETTTENEIQEYIKEFCPDKRIRERKILYVDEQTHDKLRKIV